MGMKPMDPGPDPDFEILIGNCMDPKPELKMSPQLGPVS